MVSAEEPTDSAPRAFEPGTHPRRSPRLRFWKTIGRGGVAVIFGFVLIRGTAFWIPDFREAIPKSCVDFVGNPPIRLNSAWKSGKLQKLRDAGKRRNERAAKIPRARRVCGRPRGQTRLRARTPGWPGRGAATAGGELGAALPRPHVTQKGRAGSGRSLVTHLCIRPVTTYPVFLAPGGDCKPLFIPSYRIHGGFSRGECLNVPPMLHPKGLPTQKDAQW